MYIYRIIKNNNTSKNLLNIQYIQIIYVSKPDKCLQIVTDRFCKIDRKICVIFSTKYIKKKIRGTFQRLPAKMTSVVDESHNQLAVLIVELISD